jgi:hypothetical protein
LQAHGGGRSLRIKDADLAGSDPAAFWQSDAVSVSPYREYLLGVSAKARLLKGAEVRVGIAWYDSGGDLMEVDWCDPLNQPDRTCNQDWSPLSVTARSPWDCSSARIIAGVVGTSPVQTSGSAWFDDFSFTRL